LIENKDKEFIAEFVECCTVSGRWFVVSEDLPLL
jgi:hypothetical protein